MKNVIRILILAEFAAIVFIPAAYLPRWALIPMFASMTGLVVLYWFAMFWVSRIPADSLDPRKIAKALYWGAYKKVVPFFPGR